MRPAAILLAVSLAVIGLPDAATARPGARVTVTDAVIRPAPKGMATTAAYLTLHNPTAHALTLTGVRCGCAGSVMAHQSSMQDGVSHMQAAGAVVIPPHGVLRFAPGGLHLMVMDVRRPIGLGDRLTMQLSFDHAPPLTARFAARR